MAVEMRGKVKSPARRTDVRGTQVRSRILRPGHPSFVFNKFPYRNRAALYSAGDFVSL